MGEVISAARPDTATSGGVEPTIRPPVRRWSALRLVWGQLVHASRDTWRTPVSMLISLAFPLLFLAISGLAAGTMPRGTGDATIQRLVPGAVVFAISMSAFVLLAYSVALAGEKGVLKRLRGTPLPPLAYLAGRAGAAAWVAVLGTALMVAVGMLAYGLQVTARMLPAAVLGLLVTIAVFATLGVALAMLVPSAQAVMGVAMGSVVLLGFVSDMYGFSGDMPAWLATIGWALPLRHAVEVLALPLQDGVTGSGIATTSLLALAAWGVVGGLTATWSFRREVRATSNRRSRPSGARGGSFASRSDSPLGLVWGQIRYANRSIWREPVFAGFALVMPSLFVVLLPQVVGDPVIEGVAFSASMVTGMTVFGAALTAYVALPELVATARDRGLLKRLRGTPLPAWAYLAGRILSVFWITTITVTIVLVAGWLLYDTTPDMAGWPPLILVLTAGVACFAALGMAVAALVPNADTVPAVTLATFLPLVFLSGIFPLGDALPDLIPTITAWLPVAPMVDAVRGAFINGDLLVRELAIVIAWTMGGAIIALTRFRWQ